MGLYREFVLDSSGLTTSVTAYTSGDVLGVQMTLGMNIRGSGPVAGVIEAVTITDDSAVIGAVDLFLFNATTTPAADNAAYAPSDAEMRTCVGVVSVSVLPSSGANNRIVTLSNAEQGVQFYAATGILYVVAVTRTGNSFFGGAAALQYRLLIGQV